VIDITHCAGVPDYIIFSVVLSRLGKRIYEDTDIAAIVQGNKNVRSAIDNKGFLG